MSDENSLVLSETDLRDMAKVPAWGEWQPIETAPLDGRHVLVYGLLGSLHRNDWVKACYRADYKGGKPYWQWGAPGFTGAVAPTCWMKIEPPKEAV